MRNPKRTSNSLLSYDKKPPTIMMVDDYPNILTLFEEYFKSKGYNPISVRDPRKVARQITEVSPDVILMDIAMEPMSGDAVIRALRKRGVTIPIIVISGYISKKLVVQLKDYNISAYFAKPFNFEKLEAKIHDLLAHLEI